MRKNRGQSLVECVLFFPIIGLIIVMISWWSDIYLSKLQLIAGARYGTDLIYYAPFKYSRDDIIQEVTNMVTKKGNYKGRRLNKDNLRVDAYVEPAKKKYKWVPPNYLTPENLNETCWVYLEYDINLCPWLKHIIGKDKITISARSEVFAGTGIKNK